jgi:hypothetical protein
MDEEDGRRPNAAAYEKVSLISHTDTSGSLDEDPDSLTSRQSQPAFDANIVSTDDDEDASDIINDDNNNDRADGHFRQQAMEKLSFSNKGKESSRSLLHKTLLPDRRIHFRGYPIVEGSFTVKLLKFILWTFILTAIIHVIVGKLFSDRDKSLELWHIWVFDGDLMVRDTVVFFLVGRMWQKRGIDHVAFVGTAILANVYFEAQNFVPFLQHSVTLYQMHCVWPWTLWLFVLILIPSIGALVVAHVLRAHRERLLPMKLMELALCFFFFVAPLAPSNYFHLHHWYAGWLIGMHANFDVWWSQFAMAWCWGMYMNGIAVSWLSVSNQLVFAVASLPTHVFGH